MRKARKKRENFAEGKRWTPLDGNSGAARVTIDWRSLSIFARRGRGRPKRHELDELLAWRDQIIWLLESNWPDLKSAFRHPQNPDALEAALTPYKDHGPVGFLISHKGALFEFLTSERYHGDPRHIANAMAGVGSLSWRRSFDLCGARGNRCEMLINERAWRAHMDRKFHDRFLLLRAAEKLDEPAAIKKISAIMRGTRTHDENVRLRRNKPEEVLRLLRAGLPHKPNAS